MTDTESTNAELPVEIPPRTVEEQELVDELLHGPSLSKPPKFSSPAPGAIAPAESVKDHDLWVARLRATFGGFSNTAATELLGSLVNLETAAGGTDLVAKADKMAALVHGIGPRDPLEAMLATQMVAVHAALMACHQRAALRDQSYERTEINLRHATKLGNLFVSQMQALDKHRNRGQQSVKVEHIHINGGQNVIASQIARREGDTENGRQQPYALSPEALAHAPDAPVWCPDSEGGAMPGTGSQRKDPMPNARRRQG
jgi:hypothetical protein